MEIRKHTIIVAGDFNASFARQYKDPQDDIFKSFCVDMSLTKPANYPTLHTYHQGETSSQIDYILVKKNEDTCVPNIIQLVNVKDDPQNTSDHFPVTTTLYACPKKKTATCENISKLRIDWDKVDKEEYKENVTVELEDFRYLKMKTPYRVEQSITHFINSI